MAFLILGALFIVSGIICNEWAVAGLFSPETPLGSSSRIFIWISDLTLILCGALIIFIYFIFLISCSVLSYKRENLKPAAFLWNTSHLFLTAAFLTLEVFFVFFPGLLPQSLLQFNPSLAYMNQERGEMVEYLDESPWAKFKPDTFVRALRGRGGDFTYSWKTDYLGFKNLPSVAACKKVKAVALGDSFVEGMGVATENTWASILSRKGYVVYNMGVQGYAPAQMVGALRKWGKEFKPEFVIFGYTPGFENRDLHFLNADNVTKRKVFTGGLESINRYMKEKRAAYKYFRITNTVLDFVEESVKNKIDSKKPVSKSLFSLYYRETTDTQHEAFREDSAEFALLKKAIPETKKISEEIGAKMLVIIFVHRRLVYYRDVLGKEPPQDQYELSASKAVKKFCRDNGIDVIDLFPTFENYMENLRNRGQLKPANLPYFKKDGHLNEIGQELVAGEVLNYFEGKDK